jgi:hypothetical protein
MDGSVMRNVLIPTFTAVLASILFMTVHVKMYQKSVGVVQLDAIIAEHMKEYAGKDISEEERKSVSESFAKSLDLAVKTVSDEFNVVLLVSPAVVSSEPDYTAEVRRVVETEMAQK